MSSIKLHIDFLFFFSESLLWVSYRSRNSLFRATSFREREAKSVSPKKPRNVEEGCYLLSKGRCNPIFGMQKFLLFLNLPPFLIESEKVENPKWESGTPCVILLLVSFFFFLLLRLVCFSCDLDHANHVSII